MKLHNYDLVVKGNTSLKFKLDRTHALAARIIKFFDLGSCRFFIFIFIFWNKALGCLDGFEGEGIADEM